MLPRRQPESKQKINHRISRNPVVIFSGQCWPAGNWRANNMPKKCLDRNRVFQYPAPGSVIFGSQKMATRNARVSRTPLGIENFWWPNIPEHGKAQKLCHPNETHFGHFYLVKMPKMRKYGGIFGPLLYLVVRLLFVCDNKRRYSR